MSNIFNLNPYLEKWSITVNFPSTHRCVLLSCGPGGRTPLMEAAGGGYKDIVSHGMFKGKPLGSNCCFLIKKTVIFLVTGGEFGSRTTVDEAMKTIMKLTTVLFLIMEQWQPNQTESFSATIAPYPEVWYLELANPKLHGGFQQFFK